MKPTIETILKRIERAPALAQDQYVLWYKSIYEEQLIPIPYKNIIYIDTDSIEIEKGDDNKTITCISMEAITIIMKNANMVWFKK